MLVKLKQIEKAQAVYRPDDSTMMTFAEFAELWLSEKKVEWHESNYKTVEGVLNTHLLSVLVKGSSTTSLKRIFLIFVLASPKSQDEQTED